MKTKDKSILISLLLITFAIGVFRLNKSYLLLWNANKINIKVGKQLNIDKVNVKFGVSAFKNKRNKGDGSIRFQGKGKFITIFDGKVINKIPNEYGENDFLIIYDDAYYFSFRHFKLNRRHQNDYNFILKKEKENIFIDIEIKGKSPMNSVRQMKKINNN